MMKNIMEYMKKQKTAEASDSKANDTPNTQNAQNENPPKPLKRFNEKEYFKHLRVVLPLFLLLALGVTFFLPKTVEPGGGTTIKTLNAEGFPAALVFEQRGGEVKSAWLRTPAGTRKIEGLEGLSYVSENLFVTKNPQSNKDDLLWRTSYTNVDGRGVHLWVGLSPTAEKLHIATSPYNYTKWDNVPAKLVVPKGTAVYISPAIPDYDSSGKEKFQTKDSYSFVYTVRMTPEGPAFVPVPTVYRQLAELLRAGMRGEYSTSKRLAYTRMLEEFERLAEGTPPSTETLLNFQMNRIDSLSWRN